MEYTPPPTIFFRFVMYLPLYIICTREKCVAKEEQYRLERRKLPFQNIKRQNFDESAITERN